MIVTAGAYQEGAAAKRTKLVAHIPELPPLGAKTTCGCTCVGCAAQGDAEGQRGRSRAAASLVKRCCASRRRACSSEPKALRNLTMLESDFRRCFCRPTLAASTSKKWISDSLLGGPISESLA